ncbi:MAG: ANTAR domain-containing protein [Ruminococcus sp.]|nr:ANTAR domain-containing protein [Ruminococcus sp.]
MKKALIVSSSENSASEISPLLRSAGFDQISIISSGNEARRLLRTAPEISLVVIDTPLSDEFGQDLAVMIAEDYQINVILICGGDTSEFPHENGIYIISRPVNRELFSEIMELISVSGREIKKESTDILMKTEEIRLINRAKTVLMKYLNFTEPQAHRYIEKQAMNSRRSRRETALKILSDYGIN